MSSLRMTTTLGLSAAAAGGPSMSRARHAQAKHRRAGSVIGCPPSSPWMRPLLTLGPFHPEADGPDLEEVAGLQDPPADALAVDAGAQLAPQVAQQAHALDV